MLKKKKEEKLSFLKNLLLLAKFKKKNQRLEAAVLIQIIFLQFYKYGSGQARNKFWMIPDTVSQSISIRWQASM